MKESGVQKVELGVCDWLLNAHTKHDLCANWRPVGPVASPEEAGTQVQPPENEYAGFVHVANCLICGHRWCVIDNTLGPCPNHEGYRQHMDVTWVSRPVSQPSAVAEYKGELPPRPTTQDGKALWMSYTAKLEAQLQAANERARVALGERSRAVDFGNRMKDRAEKAEAELKGELPPLVSQGAVIPKDLSRLYLQAPEESETLELVERIAIREDQLRTALAQLQDANERAEREEDRRKHTQEWYATRYERMHQWMRENASEEAKHQYFNIVANGTATCTEPPTYAQLLNTEKYKREKAEAELASLRVPAGNGETWFVRDGWAYGPVKKLAVNPDIPAHPGGIAEPPENKGAEEFEVRPARERYEAEANERAEAMEKKFAARAFSQGEPEHSTAAPPDVEGNPSADEGGK